jgi:Sigma 54 modulation protein / S30EA ribosomal protein
MSIMTVVTFDGLTASEALRTAAMQHARRLERFANDISTCVVAFRSDTRRRHRPNHFHIRVCIAMHGRRIESSHVHDPGVDGSDPYVLLAHTFDAVTRRVEDYVRLRRGATKHHTPVYPAL